MTEHPPLEVKVWGDYACFTRPEMKAERVSYPVMTPSAARGLLEAIFWKPEFSWEIREIWVLRPIAHFSLVRNEVKSIAILSSAMKWPTDGGAYFADEDRAQRHTLGLRDVAYFIKADMILRPHCKDGIMKYRDQFQRRVVRGQCYHRPYLGCREFTASFGPPGEDDRPIDVSDNLGRILFDLEYAMDGSGRGTPRFFQALLEKGVLRVPREYYRR